MMNTILKTVNKLLVSVLLVAAVLLPSAAFAGETISVFKSPTCGCCEKWVEHLKQNGFAVDVHNVQDTSVYREKLGMPMKYGSCHTASINGYTIEGHVPAREIKRLLKEKPKATGLAVPAMVAGSPGMEGPRSDPYQVLLVKTDGNASVYQNYNGK
ncbi:DUF411 domain-containing protein [Sulfurirhabdus autotrophica]|uniref:Glutaredoxin domain-containing protein n=1 Tax=Sulfurirhabdus autotrophica TaxID=1706046 RepID=A0A4R3YEE6_9PROT|nr:DUF411 domain-containing protein [Sulfurirhabdus autotrophica]TCV90301.1 hypothetical protein EDC63_101271 [Sulfurirhabdus autotrophica]